MIVETISLFDELEDIYEDKGTLPVLNFDESSQDADRVCIIRLRH